MKYAKDKNIQMRKIIYFFLQNVAIYLFTVVKSIRNDRTYPQYRVRTTSLKGNLALINYFTKYPLFGTKFLDYKDWVKVVKLFKQGSLNLKININYVKLIKSNMNDKRTIFTWDHLQNFYKLNN